MASGNLNRVGKLLFWISLSMVALHMAGLFFIGRIMTCLPGAFQAILLISCMFCFCMSFGLIYYHSEAEKRARAVRLLSIASGCILLTGVLFKLKWWSGASVMIVLSVFLFSFSALPLIIKARYEKRKILLSNRVLLLSFIDLSAVIFICMGLMFRVMQWPGGTLLLILGPGLLLASMIAWNVSFRKEVRLRFLAEEQLKETLKEVEEKHLIIEEKNKEITDSITYARRIQEAILPPLDFIREHVPESFVYYRPKDIVAGDFYWAEKTGNTFMLAAADCTGHGVPGALVSVVCSNALNRSVKEFGLSDPGQILDKTRVLVLENFSKSKEPIKDGMDISLLTIEAAHGKTTVRWAGANNPLWCLRHAVGGEPLFSEIKADKQPIGFADHARPFTTHSLEAKKGDTFYLFTDGYADQFGGPKGKKFKYKQFEELLLSLQYRPLHEQQEAIAGALKNWKGSLEQIDDICIIGVRL